MGAATEGGKSEQLRKMVESDEDLADLLVKLQDHHWRINKVQLEICLRPDGSDCILAQDKTSTLYRGVLNKNLTARRKPLTSVSLSSGYALCCRYHQLMCCTLTLLAA